MFTARYGLNLYITQIRSVFEGARWHSGSATTLQTGRSRVQFPIMSLEFFSDILPVALWPWGSTQPLTEMSTRCISWG